MRESRRRQKASSASVVLSGVYGALAGEVAAVGAAGVVELDVSLLGCWLSEGCHANSRSGPASLFFGAASHGRALSRRLSAATQLWPATHQGSLPPPLYPPAILPQRNHANLSFWMKKHYTYDYFFRYACG